MRNTFKHACILLACLLVIIGFIQGCTLYYDPFTLGGSSSAIGASIYIDGHYVGKMEETESGNASYIGHWISRNSVRKGYAILVVKEGYKSCIGILESHHEVYAMVCLAPIDSKEQSYFVAGGSILLTGSVSEPKEHHCHKEVGTSGQKK